MRRVGIALFILDRHRFFFFLPSFLLDNYANCSEALAPPHHTNASTTIFGFYDITPVRRGSLAAWDKCDKISPKQA